MIINTINPMGFGKNLFKKREVSALVAVQVLLIILFKLFVDYDLTKEDVRNIYPIFQDVNVMIYIGFGFLMTFLKKYGYSAVGFNFLLSAVLVQWALLCNGFLQMPNNCGVIKIGVISLLEAIVTVAVSLIAMGVLLGKTTHLDLIVMGLIATPGYAVNKTIGINLLKVLDAGESIFVHTFGAYLGLSASFMICKHKKVEEEKNSDLEGADYTSNLFSMIGTIFLWMFWPSFNAGTSDGYNFQRAVINTYLVLCSCCVTTFFMSMWMNDTGKFSMEHIQNSTLAGGVAMGTAAILDVQPFGAILIGVIAGVLSVCGFQFVTPLLLKLNIHDTCGVNNLHGMPGVLAGVVGAIMSTFATPDIYNGKANFYEIWPARGPSVNSGLVRTRGDVLVSFLDGFIQQTNRSALSQGLYQMLALVVTVCIAVLLGLLVGLLVNKMSKPLRHFDDDHSWMIPEGISSRATSVG